jgi:hypothetical protein
MPPRGKLTDEQKQEQFENWKNTTEWAAIDNFQKERQKIEEVRKGGLQLSDIDISLDMQPFLDCLFNLV